MLRWILFLVAMALTTYVYADDISEALALYQKKEFQQAKQLFSNLANDGNVKAQEELADMYWYGDGMPIDLVQAEYWFTRAAQGGSNKAQASLEVMKARVDRKQEIFYYTSQFDGGKLQFANSGCTKPSIPAVSKSTSDIKRVTAEIQAWNTCYNDYVTMFKASPLGLSLIPKDLLYIMSDNDRTVAASAIDKKTADIVVGVKSMAEEVNNSIEAWKNATQAYIVQANGGKAGMSDEELETFLRTRSGDAETIRNSRIEKITGPQRTIPGK
jgi:hypothetical protein